MQNIRERYSIVASVSTLSLKPYAHLVRRSRWLLVVAVLVALAIPVLSGSIGEDGRVVLYAVSVYLMLHGLYDIAIKAKIQYTFDASANGIFESNLLHQHKKLMRLDEAIVFVSEANGGWHYALGAKKSQFVKSYIISEEFDPGHESQRRLQVYEQDILAMINAIIIRHCFI